VGCAEGRACPLFASAARDFRASFGRRCRAAKPRAQTTARLRAGVIAFADPAGVCGDGDPSGGRYPAHGVMTYHPGDQDGSWTETCTLPPAGKDLCTAALDYFTNPYGTHSDAGATWEYGSICWCRCRIPAMTINVRLDREVERRFRAAVAEEDRTITDVLNEILGDWALDHSYARLAEWRAADEESRAFDAAMRARRRDREERQDR
jgi:hypothetical protein